MLEEDEGSSSKIIGHVKEEGTSGDDEWWVAGKMFS